MGIQAVLIDFDGTLANTNEVIIKSFQHTYRTFLGREEDPAVIRASFGEPLKVTMGRVFGDAYENEAVCVYRSFQTGRFQNLIEAFPGMTELVKQLKKQGLKVALVTSRVRESALLGLEKFGLSGDFDWVTAIDNITKHKPDPESIDVTLAELGGIAPENAVMIGDSRFDILCAKNAGCRSVLVDWSVSGPEERKFMNADYIAKNAEDILMWIRKEGEWDATDKECKSAYSG